MYIYISLYINSKLGLKLFIKCQKHSQFQVSIAFYNYFFKSIRSNLYYKSLYIELLFLKII